MVLALEVDEILDTEIAALFTGRRRNCGGQQHSYPHMKGDDDDDFGTDDFEDEADDDDDDEDDFEDDAEDDLDDFDDDEDDLDDEEEEEEEDDFEADGTGGIEE